MGKYDPIDIGGHRIKSGGAPRKYYVYTLPDVRIVKGLEFNTEADAKAWCESQGSPKVKVA